MIMLRASIFFYIPTGYDGTSSVPLMLNFHGFGEYSGRALQDH